MNNNCRGSVLEPDERNEFAPQEKISQITILELFRPIDRLSCPSLGQIIAHFKYQSTKQINNMVAKTASQAGAKTAPTMGAKTAPLQKIGMIWKIFQRNYYEHIIRNGKELAKIREYIRINPAIWSRDRNNLENLCYD